MAQPADSLGIASNGTPDQLLESLGRLSKKSGVLATLVLDRTSGGILTTTGSISALRPLVSTTSSVDNATSNTSDDATSGSGEVGGIEQMAQMVWNFVNAAAGLVQGLGAEDEVKLLRLRTKKYEIVIVPDSKYLLVVVQETPSA